MGNLLFAKETIPDHNQTVVTKSWGTLGRSKIKHLSEKIMMRDRKSGYQYIRARSRFVCQSYFVFKGGKETERESRKHLYLVRLRAKAPIKNITLKTQRRQIRGNYTSFREKYKGCTLPRGQDSMRSIQTGLPATQGGAHKFENGYNIANPNEEVWPKFTP